MTECLHRRERFFRRILGATGVGALLIAGAWGVAPGVVDDPLPLLNARTPARIFRDGKGVPVFAARGWDAQWRFPVPLETLPQAVIHATLAVEDMRFFRHGGGDLLAACRALWQNVSSGRIVSGASTLSMQVAALACGRQRTFCGKLLQALRARRMERLHSKQEILEAYLNHAPYRGKLHGVEAAAQYYFGVPARALTIAEAALLCGLPQRPNAFRPDRFPLAARKRQHRVLSLMVRHGKLSACEARECLETPLRFRDFRVPASFEQLARMTEQWHAIRAAYPFDVDLQVRALSLLRQQCARLSGVRDGACVILPNAPGAEPVVYLGTVDMHSPRAGQVDAARAWRSAGSVLKPFFFAEAVEGGVLAPRTRLSNRWFQAGDYTPGNYDGVSGGEVTAAEALAASLNLPTIRLVEMLGVERVERRLETLGLMPHGGSRGLTLALGTGGASLLALTRAYAAMPQVFSSETAALVAGMLRRPLPLCTVDAAWKTGTANNNTDAWCVAWTPDVVVGVWLGNKDGSRSEALVGVEAAAPLAGELLTLWYADRQPPIWPSVERLAPLCAISGLTPGPGCTQTEMGAVHPRIPLRVCTRCKGAEQPRMVIIRSPRQGTYRGDSVVLPLQADPLGVEWMVDGRLLGGVREAVFAPGRHTLHAMAEGYTAATLVLEVVSPAGEDALEAL